ncbi:hypothetical protein [Yinghuangia soli]|uniref:EVE domain-containing protein n=1 Tax=Yinghuangia soli TaxID=2908204 RepID=A0AA41U5J0_9ACTN|nr:hypothetical protein [Yinghuangia soli]MCF2534000.1 hypothetical protein [Yinghuangia soli]
MKNWYYILNPTLTTMNGHLSTPDSVLHLARTAPRDDWWLAAKRHIAAGDRIWIYFATPLKQVAAMADVDGAPYEISGDRRNKWRFPATLNLGATQALNRSPVPLSELSNQRPQGVFSATAEDLQLLLKHAGL